jgi:predicted transcriptional regulator of viral defense system
MQYNSPLRLTPLEGRLLAWAQMREVRCADSERIRTELRLSPKVSRELLDKMNRRGLLVQLQRGLYLIPDKLPPGGTWQPSAEVAIFYFLSYKKARWQETGPGVFQYHGLSEQLANQSFVYNNKVSATRKFGQLEVQFIKVPSSRLGKFVEIHLKGEPLALRRIASLPRAVFDAIYDYNRFGSMSRVLTWIENRHSDPGFIKELIDCAIEHGNVASRRRIGWILSSCGVGKQSLRALQTSLGPTRSYIPMDPGKPSRGRINKEWGVLDNV